MMVQRIIYITICLLLYIHSGAKTQKMQQLASFKKIELFGKMEVRLELSKYDSIAIESGSYDVEKINFSVKDSILSVKLTDEFPADIKVKVTVFYKELTSIEAGGGIKLYNAGAIAKSLNSLLAKSGSEFDLLVALDSVFVKVNKGAFVRLTGSARVINLSTSTGGDYRATELENDITYAKMSGGTAEVAPKMLLDGNVSYGASLKYKEEPMKIKRSERMGGSISQLDDF